MSGVTRRQLIKRGMVAAGAMVWVPPLLERFSTPAFAAGPCPGAAACNAASLSGAVAPTTAPTCQEARDAAFAAATAAMKAAKARKPCAAPVCGAGCTCTQSTAVGAICPPPENQNPCTCTGQWEVSCNCECDNTANCAGKAGTGAGDAAAGTAANKTDAKSAAKAAALAAAGAKCGPGTCAAACKCRGVVKFNNARFTCVKSAPGAFTCTVTGWTFTCKCA